MSAYRTGDSPHDAGRAHPYRELLAQGPPSSRPDADGAPSAAGMPPWPDGAAPMVPSGGSAAPRTAHPSSDAREQVKVVLPGQLSPRRPAPPAGPATPAAPAAPEPPVPSTHTAPGGPPTHTTPSGPATRTAPGALPAPAVSSDLGASGLDTSGLRSPAPRPRRPAPRRRFRRYYTSAAWLVLGLGIGGFFLTGLAIDRLGAWDHEVPLQEDATLSFPRSEERWIWLPEERMGDIVCTGTDGGGANLPMRPALGYDHDDYSSAFRFPTGDGAVTLRCDAAPSPATAGWAPSGAETARVAEPVDRSRDVPFLQAALIVTLGGPALGVLMFVGTLLAQIGTGIARLVAKVRHNHASRERASTHAR